MAEPSPSRSIRWARGRGVAGAASFLLVVLTLNGSVTPPVTASSQVWILTGENARWVASFDQGLAERSFARPEVWALGGWPGASTAMGWASYAAFSEAVRTGAIPDGVSAVMYDPEHWDETPYSEQRDPGWAMRAFSELARAEGYAVIQTPHPNLVNVPGSVCGRRAGEAVHTAYLRCGIPATAARYGDTVDLQTQFLQADTGLYRAVVAAATRQARAANPEVIVVSQLATSYAKSASVLYAAWRSVHGVVDGHYLGIPGGLRAGVAVGFLRMVEGRAA